MKYYSSYGFHDFIVCCGYKDHVIEEYFADYCLHRSDATFGFSVGNRMTVHENVAEPWRLDQRRLHGNGAGGSALSQRKRRLHFATQALGGLGKGREAGAMPAATFWHPNGQYWLRAAELGRRRPQGQYPRIGRNECGGSVQGAGKDQRDSSRRLWREVCPDDGGQRLYGPRLCKNCAGMREFSIKSGKTGTPKGCRGFPRQPLIYACFGLFRNRKGHDIRHRTAPARRLIGFTRLPTH